MATPQTPPPPRPGGQPAPLKAQAVPVSRMRRYKIHAELRAIRRQSAASGVPVRTLIDRKLSNGARPEEMVPLAIVAHLSPDKIDGQIVDEISNKVTNRLMRRLSAAQADPRALAREVARLLNDQMAPRALPAPSSAATPAPAPEAAPPAPKRISIDDIEGMLDQILKEQG